MGRVVSRLVAAGIGVFGSLAAVTPASVADDLVRSGDFGCGATATLSDSASWYEAGPDFYPVHDWAYLPGWFEGATSSFPCADRHADVANQVFPITGPDGSVLATVSITALDAATSVPPVGAVGGTVPMVGDGGDASADLGTVTIQAPGTTVVITGLHAAVRGRCMTLGAEPAYTSTGSTGTVTVNGQPRAVGTGQLRVGVLGLTFNDVKTWSVPAYNGILRTALLIELYPAATATIGTSGSLGAASGGVTTTGYSRTYVGAAVVAASDSPCGA